MEPASIPDTIPEVLVAGVTWRFDETLADYPHTAGWTAKLYLRGPGAIDLVSAAGDADDVHAFSKPAADTAALAAGTYRYLLIAEHTDETKYDVRQGALEVEPDFATAAAGALQSHNERTLLAIQAAIRGQTTKDIAAYQVDGVAVTRLEFPELLQAETRYKYLVWRERNRGKANPSRKVRFGPVSG